MIPSLKEAHRAIYGTKSIRRHCSPWELSPGNRGTKRKAVKSLPSKVKRTPLMERAESEQKESDSETKVEIK